MKDITASCAISALIKYSQPHRAKTLKGFFKTEPGDYAYGDQFIGVYVSDIRKVAKSFFALSMKDLSLLIDSKIHEERLLALLILVDKYQKSDQRNKNTLYNFYLKNLEFVDNWNLVDLSAPQIIGDYLLNKNKDLLFKMVQSGSLWKRRIAIVSTLNFIKNLQFTPTCQIAEILLNDKHDLIHKPVGWMLREVGKRDVNILENFLDKFVLKMPRTSLRYAIEHFPEAKRQFYLSRR